MKLTFSKLSNISTKGYFYECKPGFWEMDRSTRTHRLTLREGWREDGSSWVRLKSFLNLGRGDFGLDIRYEPGELEGWLERYASEKPKEAIPMLLKMLVLAVKKAGLGGAQE